MLDLDSWTTGFAASETCQRIRPTATTARFDNPHRGTTTFQRFEGDALEADHGWHDDRGPVTFAPPPASRPAPTPSYPSTRVAYCRWPWRVLEPEDGRVDLAPIHGALRAARGHGQTLQIRFEPYVGDDIPDWYVATGAPLLPGGEHGPDIDSNDARYVRYWRRLVQAIGAEFDGHPDLDSVDLAYAGRYGELGGNASPATARILVDSYVDAFPRTHLLAMLGSEGAAHAAALDRAHIGWRADGFMDVKFRAPGIVPDGLTWHHQFDEYPRLLNQQGLRDAWQRAPVSLEPYQTVWHLLRAEGFSGDIRWHLDQCLKYHPSTFMAKSVEIPEPWMDDFLAFDQRLGYRFHLHQLILPLAVVPGEVVEAQLTIDNRGVAPIYRRYWFALRFVQELQAPVVRFAADIRGWLPDFSFASEPIRIPPTLRPGPARVDCAIVDDADVARVRLAIAEIGEDGWHPLTWVRVGA